MNELLTEVCSCCNAPCGQKYYVMNEELTEALLEEITGEIQYLCCECAA